MSFVSWAANKLGYHKRAGTSAIPIVPDRVSYGQVMSRAPSPATLLSESLGIPDAAARAIANRMSCLVPEVYVEVRVENGTTEDEILDDHALARLIRRPHPNLSLAQTLRLTAQYIVTIGEAYWLKVGNLLGVPTELHVIPPTMIEPMIAPGNIVRSYRVTDANGGQREYPANVFCRFYFPDPENPWRSEGYLGPSGIAADTHKFAGQHLRSHYQHDATPKTVLEANEHAEEWTTEDRERFWNLWRERFHNRSGSQMGLPAITPTGYKLVELAMQSGSDVTPLLEYMRDDILMGYGVPRSVLGQVVSGDRSSAETNQWVFDRYAVLPVANLVADGISSQLAPDFDSKLRFRFQSFVSEDKDHMLKQEKQDLELKVRAINDVRTDRMLDPVSWGEEPVGTKNDVPYDPEDARERANQPPAPPGGGLPGEKPPEDEDEPAEERVAHIQLRKKYRAKRRAQRSHAAA